jgi:diacylglycerol kinase
LTIKSEKNMKIHVVIAVVVLLVSYYLGLNLVPILFCVGLVLAFEEINSSLERLCDLVHPEHSEDVRGVKDMAAGSVLIIVVMSVGIAVLAVLELVR